MKDKIRGDTLAIQSPNELSPPTSHGKTKMPRIKKEQPIMADSEYKMSPRICNMSIRGRVFTTAKMSSHSHLDREECDATCLVDAKKICLERGHDIIFEKNGLGSPFPSGTPYSGINIDKMIATYKEGEGWLHGGDKVEPPEGY